MNSIEAICNNALDEIGYKRHIGSIWEGTPAARVALDVFGQTRDELFHTLAPDWARGDAQLTLIRQAPSDYYQTTPWSSSFPPIPWKFEYAFPDDCVNPLQIKPNPTTLPLWRPRYIPFRLNNDPLTNANSILCNEPNAICLYTRQVLDVTLWHDDFTLIVIQSLAKKFAGAGLGTPQQAPKQEQRNANAA